MRVVNRYIQQDNWLGIEILNRLKHFHTRQNLGISGETKYERELCLISRHSRFNQEPNTIKSILIEINNTCKRAVQRSSEEL